MDTGLALVGVKVMMRFRVSVKVCFLLESSA